MTADGERAAVAARLWRHPSAVLLVVQLLGVLLYPFMDTSPVGRAALSLFSLVVLVLAVRAVRAAFYAYTSFALIRYMFLDRFITIDELWATGATFTVVAWAFAYAYAAVQVVWPGSFTAAVNPDAPRTWFELLFLSFTNLTSVGLSDITPIQPQARAIVMIEQVAGLLYVALVISRIVGLTITRQRRTD